MKMSDFFATFGITVIFLGLTGTMVANYFESEKAANACLYFGGGGGLMLLAIGVVLVILGL